MTAKILTHTCGAEIPVTEHYNGVQLAMTTPRRCPGCGGQVSYNLLVNLQGKEVIMPEQNQSLSLYQRYLNAVRKHPGDYVIVKNGNGYVTFVHECWLFAAALNRMPKQINGHYQLNITATEVAKLKLKFNLVEAV